MERAQAIIDETEEIATEIYGESMTPKQQQDLMMAKKTVSVWDLASFEEQAMMSGEKFQCTAYKKCLYQIMCIASVGEEVPWRNDAYDNMDVDEVIGQRLRKIGGEQVDDGTLNSLRMED